MSSSEIEAPIQVLNRLIYDCNHLLKTIETLDDQLTNGINENDKNMMQLAENSYQFIVNMMKGLELYMNVKNDLSLEESPGDNLSYPQYDNLLEQNMKMVQSSIVKFFESVKKLFLMNNELDNSSKDLTMNANLLLKNELINSKLDLTMTAKAFLDVVTTLVKLYSSDESQSDIEEELNGGTDLKTLADKVGVLLTMCMNDVNTFYLLVKQKDNTLIKESGTQLITHIKELIILLASFNIVTEEQITALRNIIHRLVSLGRTAITSDHYFDQFSQVRDDALYCLKKIVTSISAKSRTVSRSVSRHIMNVEQSQTSEKEKKKKLS